MKLLVSNDDGYFAPGIITLVDHLVELDWIEEIHVIAPDRNRSAASNSLTLMEPLRMREQISKYPNVKYYSMTGTPTDCVHLGVNGALGFQPDMVISGINAGANMGDDVLYSGTVAAATEGRFLGKISVAVSLCGDQHFETAAKIMQLLLPKLLAAKIDSNNIININVPDIAYEALQGVRYTRLGRRHVSEPVVEQLDPRGLPIFWIGPAGIAADSEDGTDFDAVEKGFVSVTPLQIDLTDYKTLEAINHLEL